MATKRKRPPSDQLDSTVVEEAMHAPRTTDGDTVAGKCGVCKASDAPFVCVSCPQEKLLCDSCRDSHTKHMGGHVIEEKVKKSECKRPRIDCVHDDTEQGQLVLHTSSTIGDSNVLAAGLHSGDDADSFVVSASGDVNAAERDVHSSNYDQVDSVPIADQVANALVDGSAVEIPCGVCKADVAPFVCVTCPQGKHLCDSCKLQHLQHISGHNIVGANDFRAGINTDEAVKNLIMSTCQQHNERFASFCKACKNLLCCRCVSSDECKHEPESRCELDDAIKSYNHHILTKLADVETRIKALGTFQDDLSRKNDSSKADLLKEQKFIDEYCKGMMDVIIKTYNRQLSSMHSKNKAKLEETARAVKNKTVSLRALKQKVEHRINGAVSEVIRVGDSLLQEMTECLTEHQLPDAPKPFAPRFTPYCHDLSQVPNVLKSLGGISVAECVQEINTCLPGENHISAITGLSVLPSGNIVAIDCRNWKIKIFNSQGKVENVLHYENLKNPWSCVSFLDGSLKVSGVLSQNIITFTNDGKISWTRPLGRGVAGIAATSKGDIVVTVCSKPTPCVQLFSPIGEKKWEIGKDGHGNMFEEPFFVAVNSRNNIIVTDRGLNKIILLKLSSKGEPTTQSVYKPREGEDIEHVSFPCGVCVDGDDYIYVADYKNNRVISLTPDGVFQRVVIDREDGLTRPLAIAFHNEHHLLVSCEGDKEESHMMKVFKIG